MTAATSFESVSSSTPSVTQALFHAQSKASAITAAYVIGSGVLLAVALLTLAYGDAYAHMLHLPSLLAVAAALLWLALGGNVMHKQQRKVRNYTARYEAHVQHQMQVRLARMVAQATAQPRPQRPRLPVSLFGAYL